MSSFHIIEDEQEQSNSSSKHNNSSLVQHQIERKRIRTVGNFNSNGSPVTTTATASSTKFSVTSTAEGKSVVSSLSMSLERKDSIQFMPRKIAPCIIPAGQSTVIHLDNYTHFMAQRVTTTKTAIKRSEIISQGQNQLIVPSSTNTASCSSSSSRSVGVVDVDLKLILGGVTSSYRGNNKTLNMNKQKMLGTKAGSAKIRGRKNSLALEGKQPREMIDTKAAKSDAPAVLKPALKKTNRRRKVIKPRQPRKAKPKAKNEIEHTNTNEDTTSADEVEKPEIPQPENDSKVLRPCVYILQNTKCLSEMTCPYLHSDFPCKYYYLNLPCPQGFKCQFMHNGPLEPKLMEALRIHILDLLSTKPTAVETHFIQQLHNIEDLTQRLLAFQENQHQQTYEIIEVMDDADEDQVLVIDESSDDVNANNSSEPATNSLTITSNDSDNTTAQQPTTDKYDTVYENFKETNNIIDEIDQKLQNLKTTSNMTPNEKIHELQNIYELLKEQEKRLPIYENLNTATSAQISEIYNNITNNSIAMASQSNLPNDQAHIVLVNPEIVNEIQTSQENPEFDNEIRVSAMHDNEAFVSEIQNLESEENIITITDDNEVLPTTNLNVPQQSGMEFITTEKVSQQSGTEFMTEKITPQHDKSGNNDMTNVPNESEIIAMSDVPKEIEINENNMTSNMEYEEEPRSTNLNNTNLNDNIEKQEEHKNNENNFTLNLETNENNNSEQLPFESEQLEVDSQHITQEILDTNNSFCLDENEKQEENIDFDNTLKPHNETLELAITPDEKDVIESHVKEQRNNEDCEDESPPYEHIATTKPYIETSKTRIRLRSHTQQDNEENLINNNSEKSTQQLELTKPIKTRRLRLPKPTPKSSEKSNNEDYQINADIINKLIKSTENSGSSENPIKPTQFLQDVEVPLTQNVILTKRFMKKAKAKLEQQSLINETLVTSAPDHNDIDINVEQTMHSLHSGIENIDVTLLTQTSEESYTWNPSQDPLIVESDGENVSKISNEIPTSSDCTDHIKTPIRKRSNSFKSPANLDKTEIVTKSNSKRRISFENPTSSLTTSPPSTYKEQFNLGNPHVVLTKLKSPYLLPTTQKAIHADSTTANTNVNPIVTSSTLMADDKSTQKRHSFTSEYDLDSSLKENKCLKIDNSKSGRKVNFDNRKQRTSSGQSNNSKEGDFDTDSSDEQLTIVDALQTSTSSTGNERKQAFEPFSTHVVTHHSHQHVHTEQQENESDLRQQIENVSNKSDLQLQIQQQQQQKEVESTTTTGTSTITTNSNNLPHKQYEQEKAVALVEEPEKQLQEKQYESNLSEQKQIAMPRNPYGNNEDGQTQYSAPFVYIDEPEKPTSNASDKYSNAELKENVEYDTYSSLYNKLSAHSTKCQINFENSSVNITPISSPTYGDDTIASPSPVRRSLDFRMGGEIDGRLTYPPIPYILYEIDLGKIDINKPFFIDKLKKTIQLDPRIFRTHVKRQLMTLCKPIEKTSNALMPLTTFHTSNLSASFAQPTSTTMVSPYDPRSRTSAVMTDIATPTMAQQTALTPYNNMNTVAVASPSSSSSPFMQTEIPNAVPLALQYHTTAQPILQPQQQQTPNMFLYGCLQRSPWYQSLMSTMKIQINQSISQLVRALNNFHRERLLNPEMVFDVFKIDCAGELLEIMRNLGIFVDANGIINEQRHVPSFGGRSCCNAMPVNATYSFIQQVLTPNTNCTSMTTASSTYNAARGAPVGSLNANEPFVSCYIKAPEPPVQRHSDDSVTNHHHATQHEDNHNNCNRNYNNNNNGNDNNNNNNNNNNYNQNNNNNNRRYDNQFKKPYDNNYNNNNNNNNNNGNNNYQQRSNSRSYNNNPRFSKPGLSSPSRTNSSPPNSPKGGFEGGNSGNSYGGGGFGRGGRFNNNRRFNNFRNNNSDNNGGSSWSSTSDSNDNRYNNKFKNNSSPTRASSNSSYQSGSPRAEAPKSSSPPATSSKNNSKDEECWDSDN
ncbi:uncharacterized protein LOC135963653 [Calliphora vicina]|uniref:uncharacterized protein LOC135963653 n=1 Tax=Calliphora vicina TaxID=7373 RepID=UPI00325AF444